MSIITETSESNQPILIVCKDKNVVLSELQKKLHPYSKSIFISPHLPENHSRFEIIFMINEKFSIQGNKKQKCIYIYINQITLAQSAGKKNKNSNTKVIDIHGDSDQISSQMDNLIWFALSSSSEKYLQIQLPKLHSVTKKQHQIQWHFPSFKPSKIRLFFITILLVLTINLSFLPPLLISGILLIKSGQLFKNESVKQSQAVSKSSTRYLQISKKIYQSTRPMLLLFNMASFPDDLIQLVEKSNVVVEQATNTYKDSRQNLELILKPNKTVNEKQQLTDSLNKLPNQIEKINENLSIIQQKLPAVSKLKQIKEQISQTLQISAQVKTIPPLLIKIMAKNSEKKYLLFFANNMELRPGGGFIGSFGIMTWKDLTMTDLKIYDVYDADGQLTAHVDPPEPIRKYLKQPHWFLRDSAFSPDFSVNYQIAKFFLEKEVGLKDFSGAFLFTTTAIKQLLSAYEKINLVDFNEIVTKDNFYLKAQYYAEKGFFPGSTQKKTFLSALARQMLSEADQANPINLLLALKNALDEKQIVAYFEDSQIQDQIDLQYWSGRVFPSVCPPKVDNCLPDYFFPIEANLGVNKANFFINHSLTINSQIDVTGKWENTAIIRLKNTAINAVFPGGDYVNYIQIMIPKNATIQEVKNDSVIINEFDLKNDIYQTVGLLVTIPPQKTIDLKIKYKNEFKLIKGKNIYQLLLQKQIGSSNQDFTFNIKLPKRTYLINQNFTPLVKGQTIVYNTTLTADKIFFMELLRE
ncbi:hypothetical protein AUK04_02085 [Candidatus Roizmanbacteria bacterium CG2_30_33_16]|nr:MAG: hypothetical protein AUK04_02085 [Candidatus Roizmanbacteria bacterium CG2_30_33_16]